MLKHVDEVLWVSLSNEVGVLDILVAGVEGERCYHQNSIITFIITLIIISLSSSNLPASSYLFNTLLVIWDTFQNAVEADKLRTKEAWNNKEELPSVISPEY